MKKLIISLILFILFTSSAYAQDTVGEDPVRDRVKAKLEEVKKNPKAYIGLITDKTENSLQLRSIKGEILQIAVEKESATFVKTDATTSTIDYEDIAIGDHIIAMGFKNGNEVLEARRIVMIPNAPQPAKRYSFIGIVDELDKNTFTFLQSNKQILYEVETLKETKYTSYDNTVLSDRNDFEAGQKIIVMGIVSQNIITARRIHLLP